MTTEDKPKQLPSDAEKQPLLDVEPPSGKQPSLLNLRGMGASTLVIIAYYAMCSSLMLVINKVAVHMVPAPMSILTVQLLVAVVIVVSCDRAGLLVADRLEWAKVSKFIWVVLGFLGTLMANIKVLQNANVETFITFRSSTPLVLSLCDYIWLGRALPRARSWVCLVVLLAGSLGYVLADADFKIRAYYWLMLWYVFFTFDTVYVKHMCDTVRMTNWGRVYYANLLALAPLAAVLPFTGEVDVLRAVRWAPGNVAVLVLSCLMGVGMSHASYLLREAVSATLFTIIGILCKVITVIVNVLIWDKHASPAGIAALMVCVLAGTFYEQSPKRQASRSAGTGVSPCSPSAVMSSTHQLGQPLVNTNNGGGSSNTKSDGDNSGSSLSVCSEKTV